MEARFKTDERAVDTSFLVRVERTEHGPSGQSAVSFDGVAPSQTAREGAYEVAVTGYVLDGTGTPAERVLAAFKAGGLEAVTRLDGSFGAVVADQSVGQAWAMTDVVSSRAIYLWQEADGSLLVSNTLAEGPTTEHELDPAGVAAYLASDGTHGGLTLFAGVSAVNSGSIVELVSSDPKQVRYWRIDPEPRRATDEFESLRDEMADLMRRSVARRLEAAGTSEVRISLSGGVDSKGLLGILLEEVGREAITAVSYYHGEQVGDMDLPEAQRVARLAGVEHVAIEGYLGDFPSLLAYNSLQGDGAAHFCDEGDVWRTLAAWPAGATMVVGDRQAHHRGSILNLTTPQLLRMVSVFPIDAIDWFLERLDPTVADAMRSGWSDRFDDLVAEYGGFVPWQRAAHPAYIEERTSRTLALWRERFSSEAGTVINPYLDRDLLDFVAALPTEFNDTDGRLLHREAILHHWPSASVGLAAHGGWNRPSWGTEIQRHADRLREIVAGTDSRLEELIPKAVTLDLISQVERQGSSLSDASEGIGWQIRKAVKRSKLLTSVVRSQKGRRKLMVPPRIDPATLTREVLTLHLALADRESVESWIGRSGTGI